MTELFGAPQFRSPERNADSTPGRTRWLEDVLLWAPRYTARFEELVEPGSFVYFTTALFGNPKSTITPAHKQSPQELASHIYYVIDLNVGWVDKIRRTAITEIRAVAVQAVGTKPGEKSLLVPAHHTIINLSPQRAANLNHGNALAQEYIRSVLDIRYILPRFDPARLTDLRDKEVQLAALKSPKVLFPQ